MQATHFQTEPEILPADFNPEMAGFLIHIPARRHVHEALPYISGLLFLAVLVIGWMVAAAALPPTAVIGVKFRPEITYRVPLPISAFTEISTTVSIEFPIKATGKVELPDGYATGRVRFTSVESGPVSFGKDAVITRAGEVRYRLVQAVFIPAFGNAPGIAEGVVMADHPGPVGNSPGIGNFLISPSVRVQGLGAIVGGNTRTISVISESDISAVRKSLEVSISEQAGEMLKTATPAGYISMRAVEISGIDFQLPAIGTEMNGQSGKATAKVRGLAIHPEIALRDFAYQTDSASLSSPEFKEVSETSSILVYSRRVQPSTVLETLAGWQGGRKDFNALVAYLRSLPEVESVAVPDLRNFRGFYLKLLVRL